MAQCSEFDEFQWFGNEGQIIARNHREAILREAGIMDYVLDNATAIHAAIWKIRKMYPDPFSKMRRQLARDLMKLTLPGSGWHEYYQRAVVSDQNSEEWAFESNLLVAKQHQAEQIGQVLLAIDRSDFEALRLAWANLDDDSRWRHVHENIIRHLIVRAVCTSFDLEIFAYLDERVRFISSSPWLQKYLHNSVSESQPKLFQAIVGVDKRGITERMHESEYQILLSLALDKCQAAPNTEDPSYQILTLLLQFARVSDITLIRNEFQRAISDPRKRRIVVWCHSRLSIVRQLDLFEPYQVIRQAHRTTDSELLFLAMQSFKISKSALMKWCICQGDHFDPSWFATVLNAKSARSSLE